jgi:hypothetical protein
MIRAYSLSLETMVVFDFRVTNLIEFALRVTFVYSNKLNKK